MLNASFQGKDFPNLLNRNCGFNALNASDGHMFYAVLVKQTHLLATFASVGLLLQLSDVKNR